MARSCEAASRLEAKAISENIIRRAMTRLPFDKQEVLWHHCDHRGKRQPLRPERQSRKDPKTGDAIIFGFELSVRCMLCICTAIENHNK